MAQLRRQVASQLRRKVAGPPHYRVCFSIQSDIVSSASGAMVSSILAYSLGLPVWLVWNKWLSLGSFTIA